MEIQGQNFGIEIELTGITRERAAAVIANFYGTGSQYIGGTYSAYSAIDTKRRTWKCMSDSSIRAERKRHGTIEAASSEYKCEVVSPILQYEDIEDLQKIVRELVKCGAMANSSCGIHVHVDASNHNNDSIQRLINFATGRQDLFYEALQIGDREHRWCHKMNKTLLEAIKKDTVRTRESLERIWYSRANDGYASGVSHEHYNATRYHGINCHATFTKGTVEFRLFNGTTHAGKIKAYIQFCLGMSAWSINCKSNKLYFKSCSQYTQEQKAVLMNTVLTKRLGLTGPEFKTCRHHMTSAFATASA